MRTWRDNPFFKKLKGEEIDHASLVEWLNWVKPGLWFHYPAGITKNAYQQYWWVVMGGKQDISDFVFLDPKQGYVGMVLELKAEGTVIFKKDGTPRAEMVDQWNFLQKMKKNGWRAELIAGKENARKVIADYYGIKI